MCCPCGSNGRRNGGSGSTSSTSHSRRSSHILEGFHAVRITRWRVASGFRWRRAKTDCLEPRATKRC